VIPYKYNEDRIIADLQAYIDRTYNEHYRTDDIDCIDAWFALGSGDTTCRDISMKHLWRYGKKNGKNKDDLMKVLHYTIRLLNADHYKDKK